jgi:hypothetical protein
MIRVFMFDILGIEWTIVDSRHSLKMNTKMAKATTAAVKSLKSHHSHQRNQSGAATTAQVHIDFENFDVKPFYEDVTQELVLHETTCEL